MGVSTEISIGLAHEVINAFVRRGVTKKQLTLIAENSWGITDRLISELLEQVRSSQPIRLRPIEDLGLSVRSYNALKRQSVDLISDLCNCSEAELLNLRNFGPPSINEVKDKLTKLGLSLRDD
jgi:DNA-directed RNA polymerase alpha subunit